MCFFFEKFVYNSAEVYMDAWQENAPFGHADRIWGLVKVY